MGFDEKIESQNQFYGICALVTKRNSSDSVLGFIQMIILFDELNHVKAYFVKNWFIDSPSQHFTSLLLVNVLRSNGISASLLS